MKEPVGREYRVFNLRMKTDGTHEVKEEMIEVEDVEDQGVFNDGIRNQELREVWEACQLKLRLRWSSKLWCSV